MAIQDQIAKTPLASDEAAFNYSGTDIPSDTVVIQDATNAIGDGTHYAPGVSLPATGGNPGIAIGITQEVIKANAAFPGRIRTTGLAWTTAHGAITAGQWVEASPTAGHAGQVRAHTAGQPTVGQAVSTAADADPVLVRIVQSPNA